MKIKNRKEAYSGYYKIFKLTVEQNGQTFEREQIVKGNAVAALVYNTETEKYVLTRQYRVGAEAEMVEVVAGMVDEGENPEDSMAREIEEEIGYSVDKLQHLHTFYSTPGGYNEQVYLYYAEVSEQHAAGGGKESENENIEIVEMSLKEFAELTSNDAKTIIAQQWATLRQQKN